MAPSREKIFKIEHLVYFLGFLDLFGVSMSIPHLPKFARELGASPTMTGVIGSLYGGLQLFSSPLVGAWSDSSGSHTVLARCLVISAVGYLMMGLATSVFLLLISRIPTGFFKHSQEIGRNYLSDLLPRSRHSQAFGHYNAFSSLGFILGPLVGGHMIDMQGGYNLVALSTAAIFCLSSVLTWLYLPEVAKKASDDGKPSSAKSLNPFSFVKDFTRIDWRSLWDIFAVRFLLSLAVMVHRTNFSMTLDQKFGASGQMTGYLISYSSVVGMVSAFMVGRVSALYNSDARLMLHSSVLQLMSLAAMTWAPSLPSLLVAMTPLSLANAVGRVCIMKVTMQRGEGHDVGLLLGLGASTLSVSRMLSPLLGGVAQDLHPSGPGILASLLATAGVSIMLLAPASHKKHSS